MGGRGTCRAKKDQDPAARRISGDGNSGDDALPTLGFHSAADAMTCGAEFAEKRTLKATSELVERVDHEGRAATWYSAHHSVQLLMLPC